MVNRTVGEVSRKLGLGPAAVDGILGRGVAPPVDWSRLTTLATLGLEERALPRGPGNSVAVISPRDPRGQVAGLAVLPDRRQPTVQAFLEAIPAPLKATLQTVCTDRDDGYGNAVEAVLPGVTRVVDRFPVAQAYRARVDHRRHPELKRRKPELPAAAAEPLKGL